MADDTIDLTEEGRFALKDVSFALTSGELSTMLPCTRDKAYLNITTSENRKFCVCLTSNGFQVVGDDHNSVSSETNNAIYETVYSLLESISPSYTRQFSEELIKKLSKHCDT